jgi:hypothetical protein
MRPDLDLIGNKKNASDFKNATAYYKAGIVGSCKSKVVGWAPGLEFVPQVGH